MAELEERLAALAAVHKAQQLQEGGETASGWGQEGGREEGGYADAR